MVAVEDVAVEAVVAAEVVEKAATEDINKEEATDPKMTTETGIVKSTSPTMYSSTLTAGKRLCYSGGEMSSIRRTEMRPKRRKIGSSTES